MDYNLTNKKRGQEIDRCGRPITIDCHAIGEHAACNEFTVNCTVCNKKPRDIENNYYRIDKVKGRGAIAESFSKQKPGERGELVVLHPFKTGRIR